MNGCFGLFRTAWSLPDRKGGVSDTSSNAHVPVSDARSPSNPAAVSTSYGCRASTKNTPVLWPPPTRSPPSGSSSSGSSSESSCSHASRAAAVPARYLGPHTPRRAQVPRVPTSCHPSLLHPVMSQAAGPPRSSLRRDDELVGAVVGQVVCGQIGSNLRLAHVLEAA